jgi:hypothetical protein
MADEQSTPSEQNAPPSGDTGENAAGTGMPPAGEPATPGDAWKEVGAQFQALGTGLAAAFRIAWTNEENRRHLKEMQGGLESMVNELGAAIKASTSSLEAQHVKDDAGKTLETVRVAGEKTVQEVRPALVGTLRQANEQLQKLVGRMKQQEPKEPGSTGSGPES